jgi:acyl-CoA synthetase (AMP-forming)/AMP-acid ligase II
MLIDLLRATDRDSGRIVVATDTTSVTAAELTARAQAVAAGLTDLRADRVACVIEDVAELLAVLCGAAAAGVEACVCPTYFDEAALGALMQTLGRPLVVTDLSHNAGESAVVSVDALAGTAATDLAEAPDPRLLILTTGTTGDPKPTRHRWQSLIAGVAQAPPRAKWLLTYNVNQFAGLQVLLHALVNAGTIVVPRSRRPIDAADTIRKHGVTHVSATPTFWRLLLVAAGDDTRSMPLEQITLGGEVVPGELLERLRGAFPQARLTHIYAGTEFGSAIAVSDGKPGLPADLLDRPEGGRVQIKVIDDELWVRSSVGMVGYLDDADAGDWIATGDLVERVGDRLMFTGRITERINVGGTKVSPHSVESVVHAVPGVMMAAAYGRPNPITGAIVAVDVVSADGVDRDALRDEIRSACEQLPAAARPRLIKFVDELAQRGGKVTRTAKDGSSSNG